MKGFSDIFVLAMTSAQSFDSSAACVGEIFNGLDLIAQQSGWHENAES